MRQICTQQNAASFRGHTTRNHLHALPQRPHRSAASSEPKPLSDLDVRREVFERLAGDFWERAAAPLVDLLARNADVKVADLAAVELLGGGSRIPRVQAALSAALGGRALDRCVCAQKPYWFITNLPLSCQCLYV